MSFYRKLRQRPKQPWKKWMQISRALPLLTYFYMVASEIVFISFQNILKMCYGIDWCFLSFRH